MPRNQELPHRAARTLERFFDGQNPYDDALQTVMGVLAVNPDLSMAQIFGKIAFLKGKGKSHCSGAIDGKMKRT